MTLPQGNEQTAEAHQTLFLCLASVPREPVLDILAPRVVVAALRPAVLVAADQHRRAGGQEEGRHEVAHLPLAEREHLGVDALALFTAIPGDVVVIAALLGIVRVHLLVEGDQVTQCEAVVRGDKVDGVAWAAAPFLVEIRAAADAAGKIALQIHPFVALDETPDRVTELAIPLCKSVLLTTTRREAAYEVAIRPGAIPRLRNELHVCEQGVVGKTPHQQRVRGDLAILAAK
mmetsp:Transcript_167203/g.537080  ORF Transcript_167203/g.537080 Transcript_167203/m.537080 type:complete len:232 (-) Transcript_167203:1255-1950(-)